MGAGGATYTRAGGAYTGGGGAAYTGAGAATAGTPPKTPVPERIWLNTAKAPRPSAASVAAPARATPGSSRRPATVAARAKRFMVSSSCSCVLLAGYDGG